MIFENIKFPHLVMKSFTNLEANQYITKNLKIFLSFSGYHILHHNPHIDCAMYFMTFATHVMVVSYIFLVFSDVPISVKLEGFCLMGLIYQGIHKLYTAIFQFDFYISIFEIIRNLHKDYLNDLNVAPTLKQICVYCAILVELIIPLYVSVVTAYILLPIFMWKINGILMTLLPVTLPFIDWHTPIGYIVNLANHIFITVCGVTGIASSDLIFIYFVLHSIGYLQIFKSLVDKLDELLESYPQDLHKIDKQLNECIKAHKMYNSFIKLLDQGYAQLCLAQLILSEIVLTLALFLTLWSRWIIGPFTAIAGVFQLLGYCVLGTVVTVHNEKASDYIYGMKWYLLPAHQQKKIILMILRAETAVELNVGSFAKLNVETCMQVLKTTYSYLMMMLEFIN